MFRSSGNNAAGERDVYDEGSLQTGRNPSRMSAIKGMLSPIFACYAPTCVGSETSVETSVPMETCVGPQPCVGPRRYRAEPPRSSAPEQNSDPSSPSSAPEPQQTANIETPHPNDVLCGRGGSSNRHVGNLNFRALVGANKEMYVTLTKKQKMNVARAIVDTIKNQDPPGRFLQKDVNTGLWFDIGLPRSLEKTSQALREKTSSSSSGDKNSSSNSGSDGKTSDQNKEEEDDATVLSETKKSASAPLNAPKWATPASSTSSGQHPPTPPITIPEHLLAQFKPERRQQHQDGKRRRENSPISTSHPSQKDCRSIHHSYDGNNQAQESNIIRKVSSGSGTSPQVAVPMRQVTEDTGYTPPPPSSLPPRHLTKMMNSFPPPPPDHQYGGYIETPPQRRQIGQYGGYSDSRHGGSPPSYGPPEPQFRPVQQTHRSRHLPGPPPQDPRIHDPPRSSINPRPHHPTTPDSYHEPHPSRQQPNHYRHGPPPDRHTVHDSPSSMTHRHPSQPTTPDSDVYQHRPTQQQNHQYQRRPPEYDSPQSASYSSQPKTPDSAGSYRSRPIPSSTPQFQRGAPPHDERMYDSPHQRPPHPTTPDSNSYHPRSGNPQSNHYPRGPPNEYPYERSVSRPPPASTPESHPYPGRPGPSQRYPRGPPPPDRNIPTGPSHQARPVPPTPTPSSAQPIPSNPSQGSTFRRYPPTHAPSTTSPALAPPPPHPPSSSYHQTIDGPRGRPYERPPPRVSYDGDRGHWRSPSTSPSPTRSPPPGPPSSTPSGGYYHRPPPPRHDGGGIHRQHSPQDEYGGQVGGGRPQFKKRRTMSCDSFASNGSSGHMSTDSHEDGRRVRWPLGQPHPPEHPHQPFPPSSSSSLHKEMEDRLVIIDDRNEGVEMSCGYDDSSPRRSRNYPWKVRHSTTQPSQPAGSNTGPPPALPPPPPPPHHPPATSSTATSITHHVTDSRSGSSTPIQEVSPSKYTVSPSPPDHEDSPRGDGPTSIFRRKGDGKNDPPLTGLAALSSAAALKLDMEGDI